jgi:two-component sensor histidine kinase
MEGVIDSTAPRSLVWHLGLAALTVALPLIMVATILVAWVTYNERAAKQTALTGDARTLAGAVSSQIDIFFVLSKALSHSSFLQSDNLEAFKKQANDILGGLSGVTLIVYAVDGRPLLGVPQLPGDTFSWRGQADLVKRAIESKVAFLSDVSSSASSVAPHASIERPVLREGEPIYEIELLLGLGQFADVINRQGYPTGWLAGVVDRNGNFVARIPARDGMVGAPASAEFRAATRRPPSSIAGHMSVDGRQIVSAYAVIPDGWTVGVAADASQFQVGPSALVLTVALAAVALAVSFTLSLLYGRRFTRSIRELQTKAKQLSAGTRIDPGSSGVTELDAVSDALVEASNVLRRRADRQKEAEDELRNSEEHFRLLADSVPQLVWTARPDGRIDYANTRRDNYGNGGVSRTDWEAIIHPDDRRATAEAWLRASEAGAAYEKEHRLMVTGKGYRWHLSRAAPLLDAKGAVVRWYGTTTDIDDSKVREGRIRSLVAEVNHRSRNLLAVAQSIARQSVKDGESAREFEQRYSRRLLALVASQNLLTDHRWSGVALDALIDSQIRHAQPSIADRVTTNGPSILLNSPTAQTLGLAIHELFSNAVRYGALSNVKGEVAVTWRIDDDDPEAKFEMMWSETGGPPIRKEPTSGFGSVLMLRMVAQGMNGIATLKFDNDGVIWRLTAPLKEIVIGDG